MIKTDYHIHSSFSNDSETSMQSIIEKAISLGLEEIAFTDHHEYTVTGEDFPCAINYPEYLSFFNEMKEKYASKINLVFAAELGLNPRYADQLTSFAKKWPFDFIIGSSHDISNIYLYTQEFFAGKDKQSAYMEYFLEVLENIRTMDCFCVYGHLDYITRYYPFKDRSLYYSDYKDIIDIILRELIQRGKGLEINTSGYFYGLHQLHPQLDILKQYKALGGEIITVGSDAHTLNRVGEHFDLASHYLKESGFKSYCRFKNQKPIFIPL